MPDEDASPVLLHRYGDSLRSGWRNVLDCVIRLHSLGLLPTGVVLLEAGEPDAGKLALPRAPASRRSASATSIISRAFSRCAAVSTFGTVSGQDHGVYGASKHAALFCEGSR